MRCFLIAGLILLTACGAYSPTGTVNTPPPTTTQPPAPAQIAGNYTFTLTASPSCAGSLPRDIRQLTYPATITQSGDSVFVNLAGGQFAVLTIQGSVTGTRVDLVFSFGDLAHEPVGVVVTCSATLHLTGSTLSGTCQGSVNDPAVATCNAADHMVTFTPR